MYGQILVAKEEALTAEHHNLEEEMVAGTITWEADHHREVMADGTTTWEEAHQWEVMVDGTTTTTTTWVAAHQAWEVAVEMEASKVAMDSVAAVVVHQWVAWVVHQWAAWAVHQWVVWAVLQWVVLQWVVWTEASTRAVAAVASILLQLVEMVAGREVMVVGTMHAPVHIEYSSPRGGSSAA